MGMFDRFIKTEERTLENPNAPVSADDFLHIMGWGDFSSSAGVTVNVDNALGVPAVWSAVNFISGTLASLPLEVHRRTDTGYQRVRDGVGAWLDRAVNPTLSSFAWRKYIFEQVLTGGRSVTLMCAMVRLWIYRAQPFGSTCARWAKEQRLSMALPLSQVL